MKLLLRKEDNVVSINAFAAVATARGAGERNENSSSSMMQDEKRWRDENASEMLMQLLMRVSVIHPA